MRSPLTIRNACAAVEPSSSRLVLRLKNCSQYQVATASSSPVQIDSRRRPRILAERVLSNHDDISFPDAAPVPRTARRDWRLVARLQRHDLVGSDGGFGGAEAGVVRPSGEVEGAGPR